MIQVVVFIPESHLEIVKEAMFEAGGGKIGHYDQCSFEYQGVGQFRALPGSSPFSGKVGRVERVLETKLEMACEDHLFNQVIRAMIQVHPYETPAYYGIKSITI